LWPHPEAEFALAIFFALPAESAVWPHEKEFAGIKRYFLIAQYQGRAAFFDQDADPTFVATHGYVFVGEVPPSPCEVTQWLV
jgi:hypothetical protein